MVDLEKLDEYVTEYMKRTGKKLSFILDIAGIPRANYYNRKKGVGEFTASEMYGIKKATEMSESVFREIFFAEKAEYNSAS